MEGGIIAVEREEASATSYQPPFANGYWAQRYAGFGTSGKPTV